MVWLIIVVFFVVLWIIEVFFGWLYGVHFRGLLMIAALTYFGITINALRTSQAELQRELKRLWKTVKTLQATNTSRQQTQEPQTRQFNLEPVSSEVKTSIDVASEENARAVILDNDDASISSSNFNPTRPAQPGFIEEIPVPAMAENLPPPKDEWASNEPSQSRREPNAFELWLAGGNWIVRGGLAILFIGLVFLAKFAYENALLPIEIRLAAIAGFAVALLMVGWRSRIDRATYGLSLQGGGVAALYLTIFATSKLTSLLPPIVAMVLMLLVAVLAAWLAIQQDAMVLAVIGTIGGFMVPVLMSTGQGSHIALFSYFAALNAGILTVALQKAWRPLNVLAFFFTYVIAGLWGLQSYQPEHQISCLLFLTLFFAMFVIVSILYTKHQSHADESGQTIDATLLFGVPTVTFGYGLYLLKSYEYVGSCLALILSAIYLTLAYLAKGQDKLAQLKVPWAAISLLSTTIAVPLAFDARITSSIWALEGAAVASYGWWQLQLKTRLFGYFLIILGTLNFLMHWPDVTNSVPVFNALTLGLSMLTLAYGVIGMAVNRANTTVRSGLALDSSDEALSISWVAAIAMAIAGALIIFIELFYRNSAAVASIAVPALLWAWALALQRFGHFSNWPQTVAPTIVLPLLTLLLPIYHSWLHDGLTTQGLIFTTFALVALLAWQAVALKQLLPDLKILFQEHSFPVFISALPGFTLVVYWITMLVRGQNTWSSALVPESGLTLHGWFLPLVTVLPVALLWWLVKPSQPSTIAENSSILWCWLHGDDNLPDAAVNQQLSVFALLILGFVCVTTLFHSGQGVYGLTYLPLLNLYELIAIAGLFALLRMLRFTEIGCSLFGEKREKFLSVLTFFFANSILSRILVNYFGAEFGLGFAWHSAIAATTYSIVWSFSALVMMWLASNEMKRGLWITGAILLAIVAIKLLMIDLSKVGSLARIVSFIGVGVLMLVVGYVAPIPSNNKVSDN